MSKLRNWPFSKCIRSDLFRPLIRIHKFRVKICLYSPVEPFSFLNMPISADTPSSLHPRTNSQQPCLGQIFLVKSIVADSTRTLSRMSSFGTLSVFHPTHTHTCTRTHTSRRCLEMVSYYLLIVAIMASSGIITSANDIT